ncbi:MAG: hypothetical protein GKR88_06365 [Flavobacteriaceae bacterium]|nr:MAG: hypothetical protein GKR88_06365 [Flavobacteriaceae bacterium]
MYSLQLNDLKKSLIIYKYEDIYQVSVANYYEINNEVKKFELNTLDKKLFYSINVDSENKMGDFVLSKNSQMNNFSNQVSLFITYAKA